MGIRPSSFKKGGGFLNDVTGVITNYQISDAFNGEPWKAGKITPKSGPNAGKPVDRPHSLNCALSFRVDGAEEDVTTTLKVAGDADVWAVSDDGYTFWDAEYATAEEAIAAEEADPSSVRQLGSSAQISKFLVSLCNPQEGELKFPEESLPEHGFDFRAIIGTRCELTQAKYGAEEIAAVKKLGATEKRAGKDGKTYDRTNLLVKRVLELPTRGKTAAPSKSASRTNGSGKTAAPAPSEDLKDLATAGLTEILTRAGGGITKAKLSVKVLTTPLLKGHPQQEKVREWLVDDDNLEALVAENVITYNQKKGQIELAA